MTFCGGTRACRYEPDLNPTYQDLSDHYEFAANPARKAKARDKAKIEAGVRLADRYIQGSLRDQRFFRLSFLREDQAKSDKRND